MRRGRFAGAGAVRDLGPEDLTAMMIGEPHAPADPERLGDPSDEVRLAVRDLRTAADGGRAGLAIDALTVHAREIVGIAGVSGNGQKDLVEVLGGQRPIESGSVEVDGASLWRRPRWNRRRMTCACCPRSRCAMVASPA